YYQISTVAESSDLHGHQISAGDYISIVSIKDFLTWYENDKPDIRAKLISRFTRDIKNVNPDIKIVGIKCQYDVERHHVNLHVSLYFREDQGSGRYKSKYWN